MFELSDLSILHNSQNSQNVCTLPLELVQMTACLQNVLGCESRVNLNGFLLDSLKNSWQKLFGNVIYQKIDEAIREMSARAPLIHSL